MICSVTGLKYMPNENFALLVSGAFDAWVFVNMMN